MDNAINDEEEENLELDLYDELRFDQGLEEPLEVSEISRDAADQIRDSLIHSADNIPFGILLYKTTRKRSKSHPENLLPSENLVHFSAQ
jgi:hypothetical protein